ncbi:MAG TPA: hypothetical protein VK463_00315 [Desulfomonilaceae bacterium]|nr:hypothetical protein [Desulfomonilaceae bacterium]
MSDDQARRKIAFRHVAGSSGRSGTIDIYMDTSKKRATLKMM